MDRVTAEKVIGQMINEVTDRCDVCGGMKTWDGGRPMTRRHLENVQTAVVGG
jgi:hypothetical protein